MIRQLVFQDPGSWEAFGLGGGPLLDVKFSDLHIEQLL